MLRLFCFLAGLAATVTGGVVGACVVPFKEVGEGCYYFSVEDNLQLNWTPARQYCQSLGSEVDLVVMGYLCDDFDNIANYLMVEGMFYDFEYAWIGASGGELTWFWVDGRPLSLSSSHWMSGYPFSKSGCGMVRNFEFINSAHEHYPRIYYAEAHNCTSSRPFICQDFNVALQQ